MKKKTTYEKIEPVVTLTKIENREDVIRLDLELKQLNCPDSITIYLNSPTGKLKDAKVITDTTDVDVDYAIDQSELIKDWLTNGVPDISVPNGVLQVVDVTEPECDVFDDVDDDEEYDELTEYLMAGYEVTVTIGDVIYPSDEESNNDDTEDVVDDTIEEIEEVEDSEDNVQISESKKSSKKVKEPKVKYARKTGHLVKQIPTPTCTGNVAPTLMATGYGTATYKNFYSVGHFPKLGILEVWEDNPGDYARDVVTDSVHIEKDLNIDNNVEVENIINADSLITHNEPIIEIDEDEAQKVKKQVIIVSSNVNNGDTLKDTYGQVKQSQSSIEYNNIYKVPLFNF